MSGYFGQLIGWLIETHYVTQNKSLRNNPASASQNVFSDDIGPFLFAVMQLAVHLWAGPPHSTFGPEVGRPHWMLCTP